MQFQANHHPLLPSPLVMHVLFCDIFCVYRVSTTHLPQSPHGNEDSKNLEPQRVLWHLKNSHVYYGTRIHGPQVNSSEMLLCLHLSLSLSQSKDQMDVCMGLADVLSRNGHKPPVRWFMDFLSSRCAQMTGDIGEIKVAPVPFIAVPCLLQRYFLVALWKAQYLPDLLLILHFSQHASQLNL